MSAEPFDSTSPYASFVPGTLPPRKLNGGLYTGEPFAGDWGNVPVVPDSGDIVNRREFASGNQPICLDRIGNSTPQRVIGTVRVTAINAEFPSQRTSGMNV